jgi:hypothetical protein
MAKRKHKKKSGKHAPEARKSTGRKSSRARGAQAVLPEESHLFTDGSPSLAPAIPSERKGPMRGGKSTLSMHELLAEVPTPTRPPRPATRPAGSRPKPPAPQPKPTSRPKPAQGSRPTQSSRLTQSSKPNQAQPRPAQAKPLSMSQIYETLAALLVPYARKMESEMHPKIGFCLKARSARTGRETHFGAVQALPDGVAYHLFPLYAHPELLENISPDLFNRMRGKTCFHFDSLHVGLVAELAELTHAGFERFLADGVF